MFTSPSHSSSSNEIAPPLQPVKLLTQRDDYVTCHIQIPEETRRLSAIALDGKFYSFFRVLKEPPKALDLLLKLTARGNQVAMTRTRTGYVIWVHEPEGLLATSDKQIVPRVIPLIFGPADCWIIGERQPDYRACSLKVPDLPDPLLGLANSRQKFYSLYRREKDPAEALKIAARLTRYGDEVTVLVRKEEYVLCIYEPAAKILPT